tara:strand:- start:53 stop:631 length:579 start_codon:yes stop_codon:yes gene_type:complete
MKHNSLKIFKVTKNKINGGSIRCYVTHDKNTMYDQQKNTIYLNKLLKNEKKLKIKSVEIYKNFFSNISKIKIKLKKIIEDIKKNNKSIYVLGASTKGNTILQFLDINNKIIPFATERNREKFGAKTIGSNIEIINEDITKKNPPDYQLVLPWHFKKEIINREKNYLKNGGKLIFPLPNIKIITKKNYLKYAK